MDAVSANTEGSRRSPLVSDTLREEMCQQPALGAHGLDFFSLDRFVLEIDQVHLCDDAIFGRKGILAEHDERDGDAVVLHHNLLDSELLTSAAYHAQPSRAPGLRALREAAEGD